MEKRIVLNGEFSTKELEMVINKIKEGLSNEDCALLNEDFSLALVITETEEQFIVDKVSNVIG